MSLTFMTPVVSASLTLSKLASAIEEHGGVAYNYTDIDPENDTSGGERGGNIRPAYLYDPSVVRLRNYNPGSSNDSTSVLSDGNLSYNPGLIDPSNEAWDDSRKPLVAQWETLDGKNTFYTINVHFTSKYDSTSLEGDPRPPVNGWVENRVDQAKVVAVSTFFALTISLILVVFVWNRTESNRGWRRNLLPPYWRSIPMRKLSPPVTLTSMRLSSLWRCLSPSPNCRTSRKLLGFLQLRGIPISIIRTANHWTTCM